MQTYDELLAENKRLRQLLKSHKRSSAKISIVKLLDADPTLSPQLIAAEVGCTQRYVRQIKQELYNT